MDMSAFALYFLLLCLRDVIRQMQWRREGVCRPGSNGCVTAPASQIDNWYSSYGYNGDIGVDCHKQYAKLAV